MNRIQRSIFFLPIAVMIAASSCVTHKELLNFSEGPEFPDSAIVAQRIPDITIQEDDLLSIRVVTEVPEAAIPFNVDPESGVGNAMVGGNNLSRPLIGYLVDKDGFIDFPVLGALKVTGLTTKELSNQIAEQLGTYLNDPVVLVRFINFRISVFGEVARPGNAVLPNERLTILDAISGSGDLTPYANRTNVLIIREYDGKREYGRINLQDRNMFNSPYFYLKQNDIIYVEPLPEKTAATRDQAQRILPWLSIITSLTTLTLTIVNLANR